jgi:hypothetical protein
VKYSLLTIVLMLALGTLTRYSGLDTTLGLAFASTGVFYPFFGTLMGWLGVALTGSDTASNVLFGGMQKVAAEQLGPESEPDGRGQQLGRRDGQDDRRPVDRRRLDRHALVQPRGRHPALRVLPLDRAGDAWSAWSSRCRPMCAVHAHGRALSEAGARHAAGPGRRRAATSPAASWPSGGSACSGYARRFATPTIAMQTTPSGLQYEDTVVGDGATAASGQHVTVHYTGWLYQGRPPAASSTRARIAVQPFEFSLGAGMVIRGWTRASPACGRRHPAPGHFPRAGYGARGAGGVIPPNATLLFEVELLGAE